MNENSVRVRCRGGGAYYLIMKAYLQAKTNVLPLNLFCYLQESQPYLDVLIKLSILKEKNCSASGI